MKGAWSVAFILKVAVVAAMVLTGSPGTRIVAAQSSMSDRITVRGYLKFMQTNLIESADSILTDNLVHNRLSIRARLGKGFSAGVEARNRVFYGEIVKSIPGYGDLITSYDGVLDLEWLWVNTSDLVINTIVDRAWLNYGGDLFEARIGRQRINWGYNPVWNPNDLFNAFDYLDFDYEERPGSDAVHGEYYLGDMSSIDVAYKWAAQSQNNVGAVRLQLNRWEYDMQFIIGRYQQDWAIGTGWAGVLGTAGFKGEATLFIPSSDAPEKAETTLSLTSSIEYGFKNGWNVLGSYLLNTGGATDGGSLVSFLTFTPGAKNLMPNKHTVLVGAYRQFSPLFVANMSVMYAFQVNTTILLPTISYSVRQNWDLDLIGQLYWGDGDSGSFENLGNGLYLRLRWSF